MPLQTPILFVSSTSEDLKSHREAARDAAVTADFHPRMMEYFVAGGDRPPLAACLAKVSEADVLCVLVAHRYGWVPPDQPAGGNSYSVGMVEISRMFAVVMFGAGSRGCSDRAQAIGVVLFHLKDA